MSFYRRCEDPREIIYAAPASSGARATPMVRELFSAASLTNLPRVQRLWAQCAREYEICGVPPSALKDLALSMVERLNISLEEGRMEVEDTGEEEPKSYSQRIVASVSIVGLESVFDEFLDRIGRRMGRALRHQDIIEQIRRFVAEHYAERLSLDRIAQTFFISPTYFCRLFKNRTGRSFLQYLAEVRIRKAIVLMRSTRMSIEEISQEVGYQSANYFIRVFKKIMGVTVGEFMKRSIGVYGKTFIHCEEKTEGFA
jgi:AraC-like DNA-binding protein